MYPKYSVKQLSIGKSIPVKLRLANIKERQVGVIRKLTEIFCQRVAKKNGGEGYKVEIQENFNKENRSRTMGKMIPIQSRKNGERKCFNIQNRKKDQHQKRFAKCLQEMREEKKVQSVQSRQLFTPYHLQQELRGRRKKGNFSRNETKVRRTAPQRKTATATDLTGNKSNNWQIQKWQTGQQSIVPSFIIP